MTLGFVLKGEQILLGLKKRGFGKGYWNGFGGKLLTDESLEEGMKRELEEECGLLIKAFKKAAFLEFVFADGKRIDGHVFLINDFSGDLIETDEMRPEWFNLNQIPFKQMWEDDILWLPFVLAGKQLSGKFSFSLDNKLKSHEIIIHQ